MARRATSLTGRLILVLTLATTALWCGAAFYAVYVSSHELNEAFDRALMEAGNRLLPLAADDFLGLDPDEARPERPNIENHSEYLSYQLRDQTGKIVLRAHDAPEVPYDKAPQHGLSTVGHYRLYSQSDAASGLTITVAESVLARRDALNAAIRGMMWPLIGLIPLNILAIWLGVRGSMRPVLRLSGDIAQRGGRNLAPLDISDQPQELRPIAEAVARLLERLRAALDAERAFAANAAHELRTPIAGALAQTQRLIAELAQPQDKKRARDVEGTLKRLSHLTEKLMQLSRVEAGVGLTDKTGDLLPVLDLVVGDFNKLSEVGGRIVYEKASDARLTAPMDMDAFGIVVRNLIDNALNHGMAGGEIVVRVEAGQVCIINSSPIVPTDELTGLKRRFARGRSRSSGTGLGLAIVETIMVQTGGKLELLSPATGRADGFEARVTLAT